MGGAGRLRATRKNFAPPGEMCWTSFKTIEQSQGRPGPSPAGGPVVPGHPISRFAPWLLHISNTVFFKCGPPFLVFGPSFWFSLPLLLSPGGGPEEA